MLGGGLQDGEPHLADAPGWEPLYVGCRRAPYNAAETPTDFHAEKAHSIAAAAAAAANAAVMGRLSEPPSSRESIADRLRRLSRMFKNTWVQPLTDHDAALLETINEESAHMICGQLEACGDKLESPGNWIQARVAAVEVALVFNSEQSTLGPSDESGRIKQGTVNKLPGSSGGGGNNSGMEMRDGRRSFADAGGYGVGSSNGQVNAAISGGSGGSDSYLNAGCYGQTAKGKEFMETVDGRVHRQCMWLNSNIFWQGAIDDEAMAALSTVQWPRALEICNDMREKGDELYSDPNGYIKAKVRELYEWIVGDNDSVPTPKQGDNSEQLVEEDMDKVVDGVVRRRCDWLNANIFWPGAIDLHAMQSLSRIPLERAMAITKSLEDMSSRVESPSVFVQSAFERERMSGCRGFYDGAATGREMWDEWGQPQAYGTGDGFGNCAYGATGMEHAAANGNGQEAWAGYCDAAGERGGSCYGGGCGCGCTCGCGACAGVAVAGPELHPPRHHGYAYASDRGCSDWDSGEGACSVNHSFLYSGENDKGDCPIRRHCLWLNANVFWPEAVNSAAIAALRTVAYPRAMELCKELEEKASKVQNPSGYIHAAVQNEVPEDADIDARIHKRCMWLNVRVFWEDAINSSAMAALSTLELDRAMDITRELENRGRKVTNPSGYLRAAVRKEWTGDGPQDVNRRPAAEQHQTQTTTTEPATEPRLHRRAAWLNANVFWEGAINADAVHALSTIDKHRAMEMLRELEGRRPQVHNPSGYLMAACKNECHAEGRYVDSQIHRRCTWLNANVFWHGAIDPSAIQALSCLELGRAMEMCKNLEAKGPHHISDPSRYLKSAVRQEVDL